MKKYLFFLFLTCLMQSKAQQIQQISFIPPNPVDTDYIYAVIENVFPSGGCDMQYAQVMVAGGNVYLGLYHCLGPLTYICTSIDTVEIGQLAAGNYPIDIHLFTDSGAPACSNFVDRDDSTTALTVGFSTGIHDPVSKTFVGSNGSQIVISHAKPNSRFSVYDILGKEIFSRQITETELVINPDLKGVFIYKLVDPAGGIISGKLRFSE